MFLLTVRWQVYTFRIIRVECVDYQCYRLCDDEKQTGGLKWCHVDCLSSTDFGFWKLHKKSERSGVLKRACDDCKLILHSESVRVEAKYTSDNLMHRLMLLNCLDYRLTSVNNDENTFASSLWLMFHDVKQAAFFLNSCDLCRGLVIWDAAFVWWYTNANILGHLLTWPSRGWEWMLSDERGLSTVWECLSKDEHTNTFVLLICFTQWGNLLGDLNWRKVSM